MEAARAAAGGTLYISLVTSVDGRATVRMNAPWQILTVIKQDALSVRHTYMKLAPASCGVSPRSVCSRTRNEHTRAYSSSLLLFMQVQVQEKRAGAQRSMCGEHECEIWIAGKVGIAVAIVLRARTNAHPGAV